MLKNIKSEKKLNDYYEKNLLGKKRKQKNSDAKKNYNKKHENNKIIKVNEKNNSKNN